MTGVLCRSDECYEAGKCAFLDAPDEQFRHAVIASLIASHGPGEVCDLGCGAGHLLRFLTPRFVTRYVGVDRSANALGRIETSAIPVSTVQGAIEHFVPAPRAIGSLVCSEVLYYLEDPGAVLARIAAAVPALDVMIASLIRTAAGKPNWTKGADLVTRSIAAAGWTSIERVTVAAESSGRAWEITVHRLPPTIAVDRPQGS